MNLIEAWKKAKEGQTIKRPTPYGTLGIVGFQKSSVFMNDFRLILSDEQAVLSDDWEIEKEKKKVVIDSVFFNYSTRYDQYLISINREKNSQRLVPTNIDMKMTLEWDE